MHRLKRIATLLGVLTAVLILCHSVLPRLARAPGMDVVRANMRQDFNVGAYFYTELGDYLQYEKALSGLLKGTDQAPDSLGG